MKTGKALGFKKGDFVHTGAFPGIIISDVHTATPVCEVWGFEHEGGSAYAHEMRKLTFSEFVAEIEAGGRTLDTLAPFSDVSKKALRDCTQVAPGTAYIAH